MGTRSKFHRSTEVPNDCSNRSAGECDFCAGAERPLGERGQADRAGPRGAARTLIRSRRRPDVDDGNTIIRRGAGSECEPAPTFQSTLALDFN